MFKNILKIILLNLVLIFLTISCTSVPTLAKLDPEFYEDEFVKIEFFIGVKVHNIVVTNKTSQEIHFNNKSSIISINGQTKNLDINNMGVTAENWFIPPNSRIIFTANQYTFFDENVYAELAKGRRSYYYYSRNLGIDYYYQRILFENMRNRIIRLYFSFIINGNEKIYDIPIRIDGVMTTKEFMEKLN